MVVVVGKGGVKHRIRDLGGQQRVDFLLFHLRGGLDANRKHDGFGEFLG